MGRVLQIKTGHEDKALYNRRYDRPCFGECDIYNGKNEPNYYEIPSDTPKTFHTNKIDQYFDIAELEVFEAWISC